MLISTAYMIGLALTSYLLTIRRSMYIHFHRRTSVLNTEIQLIIENEPLERVQMTKFLGVKIDEHLTWEHHINHCVKSIKWSLCYQYVQACFSS